MTEIMSGNGKNTGIFKSKGNNSAANYTTGTKFKLDLRILVTHPYIEFQFKMSTCDEDNERKVKLNDIF